MGRLEVLFLKVQSVIVALASTILKTLVVLSSKLQPVMLTVEPALPSTKVMPLASLTFKLVMLRVLPEALSMLKSPL